MNQDCVSINSFDFVKEELKTEKDNLLLVCKHKINSHAHLIHNFSHNSCNGNDFTNKTQNFELTTIKATSLAFIALFSAVVAPNKNDSPPDLTNTENLTAKFKFITLHILLRFTQRNFGEQPFPSKLSELIRNF